MKTFLKTTIFSICLFSLISCNANSQKPKESDLAMTKIVSQPTNKQAIKVALLLDTSNSMDGLIDQAKAQLWELVNELSYVKCDDSKPNLQIALYEYGNDRLNSDEGYIRQVLSFSNDLDEISKQLFSLTTNGGEEYCGHVIKTSLNQLNWESNADDLKLIFIAGNEPFTQGKISYTEATKLANTKDVTINTIFCGDYEQGISTSWKDGADLTHGTYMAINHNQATTYVASPYDDKIMQLNHKLNKTYIAYGSFGSQKMALQAEQDKNAKGYSEANAVNRTVSKSSHLYKNGSWDLVDAEEKETFNYDDLKDKDLPKELQGKSKEDIKIYISKKREERTTVQEEIQQLNELRRLYIMSQQKENNSSLESAMVNAIKIQAKQKNYKWE
ncbi:MAG: vWA domain-containing protein [Aquaticitalea sp.]